MSKSCSKIYQHVVNKRKKRSNVTDGQMIMIL